MVRFALFQIIASGMVCLLEVILMSLHVALLPPLSFLVSSGLLNPSVEGYFCNP